MSTKTKVVIAETVSKKAFLSFIIAIVIFMVTNVDILVNGDWTTRVWLIPSCLWYYLLKVLGYTFITGLLILFGIQHPGISRLIEGIQDALRDGKITPQEKLGLIMLAKDEFLGAWADLAAMVTPKSEEKEKIEPLVVPPQPNPKL
jgi:hypothetical protein